jgi:hypothetical protein
LFKELVQYHAATQLVEYIGSNKIKTIEALLSLIPARLTRGEWCNAGGQLVQQQELNKLIKDVQSGKIKSWEEVHHFYTKQGEQYSYQKLLHALAALKEVMGTSWKKDPAATLKDLLKQSISTKEWMTKNIFDSRAKDYTNSFRKMMYGTQEEMDAVLGKLDDNSFINQEVELFKEYKKKVREIGKIV